MVSTSHDMADSNHPTYPDTSLWSARAPSSSVPDLPASAVGQGEFAIRSPRICEIDLGYIEGLVGETSRASTPIQPASTNPETQVSDRKTSAKENLEVASRFMQTLLKKVPDCVSTNPVKMAFSIAKVIIEIKDVGHLLYI